MIEGLEEVRAEYLRAEFIGLQHDIAQAIKALERVLKSLSG